MYVNEMQESIGRIAVGVRDAERYSDWIRRGENLISFASGLGIEVAPPGAPLDKWPWPENQWPWTDEYVSRYNALIDYIEAGYDNYFVPMQYTEKGCISRNGELLNPCQIGLTVSINRLFLAVYCPAGAFKISFGGKCEKNKEVSFWGKQGFDRMDYYMKKATGKRTFEILKEAGHELTFDEGTKVKESIKQPLKIIYLDDAYKDKKALKRYRDINTSPVFEHVYHDDLNSSFCAGILKYYPELAPGIMACYERRMELKAMKEAGKLKRKNWVENELAKFALSSYHGYLQRKKDPRYAQVAKAGIEYNNLLVDKRINDLHAAGYLVISINIDGIWYQDLTGQGPFVNEENGPGIGQWKCDHRDCKFRIKSAGAYEYIENGKYDCALSGTSSYENVVPRSKWWWGDIFKGKNSLYRYNPETSRIETKEED